MGICLFTFFCVTNRAAKSSLVYMPHGMLCVFTEDSWKWRWSKKMVFLGITWFPPGGGTIFHSHLQCMRIPVSPQPHLQRTLVPSVVWIWASCSQAEVSEPFYWWLFRAHWIQKGSFICSLRGASWPNVMVQVGLLPSSLQVILYFLLIYFYFILFFIEV